MKIYISDASKRHYWKEENYRAKPEVDEEPQRELTQIEKFYKKFPQWKNKEEYGRRTNKRE